MTPDEQTDYDVGARFAARLNGVDFLTMILNLNADIELAKWMDTRTQSSSVSSNLTSDLIGHFVDQSQGGVPWCVILEFKTSPSFNAVGQLYRYLGENAFQRPDKERGSSFEYLLLIVNLTGQQKTTESRSFADSGLSGNPRPRPINLESFDAYRIFERIDRGELGFTVLPFTVLMEHGDEPEMIARWLNYAARETDARFRNEFFALAILFAHACGREAIWKEAFKDQKMGESEIVKTWKREARQEGEQVGRQIGRQEGREEGELIGKIQLLERFLSVPPTPKDDLVAANLEQLRIRLATLESQWQAGPK